MKAVLSLILLLFGANAYLQYSIRYDSFWQYNYDLETKTFIENNQKSFAPYFDYKRRREKCIETDIVVPFDKNQVLGYCRYPHGNGNASVMIIGNSYVLSFAEKIEQMFGKNYSEFRYISIAATFGTYVNHSPISRLGLETVKKQIELHKPDVLFIIARFTKKIYILDVFPPFTENFMTLYLHYLVTRSEDLDFLHLDKRTADLKIKNVRKRLNMIQCDKCQLFDLSHLFIEGDKYLTFDRNTMISYIDDYVHLTTVGVALCEPVLKNITENILKTF